MSQLNNVIHASLYKTYYEIIHPPFNYVNTSRYIALTVYKAKIYNINLNHVNLDEKKVILQKFLSLNYLF